MSPESNCLAGSGVAERTESVKDTRYSGTNISKIGISTIFAVAMD